MGAPGGVEEHCQWDVLCLSGPSKGDGGTPRTPLPRAFIYLNVNVSGSIPSRSHGGFAPPGRRCNAVQRAVDTGFLPKDNQKAGAASLCLYFFFYMNALFNALSSSDLLGSISERYFLITSQHRCSFLSLLLLFAIKKKR